MTSKINPETGEEVITLSAICHDYKSALKESTLEYNSMGIKCHIRDGDQTKKKTSDDFLKGP